MYKKLAAHLTRELQPLDVEIGGVNNDLRTSLNLLSTTIGDPNEYKYFNLNIWHDDKEFKPYVGIHGNLVGLNAMGKRGRQKVLVEGLPTHGQMINLWYAGRSLDHDFHNWSGIAADDFMCVYYVVYLPYGITDRGDFSGKKQLFDEIEIMRSLVS